VITAERAEEIRAAIWGSHGWEEGGATAAEKVEIHRFWDTLPGSCSFYDAVARMAKGAHLAAVATP
jgi:hypothetical protein